jgi:hypothetical protein
LGNRQFNPQQKRQDDNANFDQPSQPQPFIKHGLHERFDSVIILEERTAIFRNPLFKDVRPYEVGFEFLKINNC